MGEVFHLAAIVAIVPIALPFAAFSDVVRLPPLIGYMVGHRGWASGFGLVTDRDLYPD